MLSISSSQKLDLAQLRAKRQEKEVRRYKCFDDILAKCHRRVVKAAETDADATIFRVPSFQLGMPPINMNACICYLIYNLRQNGLQVEFVYPDLLYLAWNDQAKSGPSKSLPRSVTTESARHHALGPVVVSASTQVDTMKPADTMKLVDRALFKPIKDPKPVYDTDAMDSLTRFAQRIKKRHV